MPSKNTIATFLFVILAIIGSEVAISISSKTIETKKTTSAKKDNKPNPKKFKMTKWKYASLGTVNNSKKDFSEAVKLTPCSYKLSISDMVLNNQSLQKMGFDEISPIQIKEKRKLFGPEASVLQEENDPYTEHLLPLKTTNEEFGNNCVGEYYLNGSDLIFSPSDISISLSDLQLEYSSTLPLETPVGKVYWVYNGSTVTARLVQQKLGDSPTTDLKITGRYIGKMKRDAFVLVSGEKHNFEVSENNQLTLTVPVENKDGFSVIRIRSWNDMVIDDISISSSDVQISALHNIFLETDIKIESK
jgi:hypothetical protein